MLLDTTFQKIFRLRRKLVFYKLKWLQYAKFRVSFCHYFFLFFRNFKKFAIYTMFVANILVCPSLEKISGGAHVSVEESLRPVARGA